MEASNRLRGLTSNSSSTSSSFVFDGTNSDIARQLYIRHHSGDHGDQVELNFVPDAVTARLDPFNIDFKDLPGLVQRAVLWDTGFAISPSNDPVQIWTMENYSMADIAVPKYEVTNVDCTYLNCSQPDGVTTHYTQYCTGWQMLNVSRCVVDVFEDPGAGTYLGMMWSVGGDPDMVPLIRLRDHTWIQDIEEFGGNITFSVYVVHTVPNANDPAWNECPAHNEYASLTVPCHRRDQYSDEEMAVNMTKPAGSAWVTAWLEQEFAQQNSGLDTTLLAPIIVGIVAVLAFAGWLCWRQRAKWRTSANGDHRQFSRSDSSTELAQRHTAAPSPLSLQFSLDSDPNYYTPNSNKTLQILLGSKFLQGKRIPYENLAFKRPLSKGASGDVWVCAFNGQKVAAKRLLRSKDQKADKVQAFAEEIELSASLTHPNIVEFIGVAWNSLSNLVMVLEFFPMGNLQTYLHKNARLLSWAKDMVDMAFGIAKGLEYLHTRSPPLIHRDIKSNNILLTDKVESKLIDFGLSRGLVDLTMTAGVGTPFWTAPEVLEGNRYTEQADIYSFGVVLSELDTCKTPYADAVTEGGGKARQFHILQQIMAGSLRPSFSPDCPSRILRVGAACLSLDPSDRPTAHEVVQELAADSDNEQIWSL